MRGKEREGGKCFVVLLLDWAVVGPKEEQQSSECRWQLTGLAFLCCCASVFVLLYARSDAAIENLSGRALGEVQEEAKRSRASNVPGFSPSVSFPQRQVRYDRYQRRRIKPDTSSTTTTTNNNHNHNNDSDSRSYSMSHQIPHWPFLQMLRWGKRVSWNKNSATTDHRR